MTAGRPGRLGPPEAVHHFGFADLAERYPLALSVNQSRSRNSR